MTATATQPVVNKSHQLRTGREGERFSSGKTAVASSCLSASGGDTLTRGTSEVSCRFATRLFRCLPRAMRYVPSGNATVRGQRPDWRRRMKRRLGQPFVHQSPAAHSNRGRELDQQHTGENSHHIRDSRCRHHVAVGRNREPHPPTYQNLLSCQPRSCDRLKTYPTMNSVPRSYLRTGPWLRAGSTESCLRTRPG